MSGEACGLIVTGGIKYMRVRNTLSSHVINRVDMLDLYVKQNGRVRVGVRIGVRLG